MNGKKAIGLLGSVSTLTLLLAGAGPAMAQTTDETHADEEAIVVLGHSLNVRLDSATGLDLSLRETPQSVTIIDAERIEAFQLNNANELLEHVVGINVERPETERLTFNSRGFEVTNFQVDGIGLPLVSGIQYGEIDTVLFERVDIVRGANAIMTGIGNPSATINYIRKRPQDELTGSVGVSAGSYDTLRVTGDVSVPLTDGVAGRLIYAHEEREGQYDRYELERNVYGALLSADLTSNLTATFGYTYQENLPTAPIWGGPTWFFSDGTLIPYSETASTSPDWTEWPVTDEQAFVELAVDLGGGWHARGVLTYKQWQETPTILYAFGFPDPVTGLGQTAYTAAYFTNNERLLADFVASGPIDLFGRRHQLAVGASYANSDLQQYRGDTTDGDAFGGGGSYFTYPSVFDYDNLVFPKPTFGPMVQQLDEEEELLRAYVSTQINVTDNLNFVLGVSALSLETTGYSYGQDSAREDEAISPYAGVVFDVNDNISLYASYTDIYSPQNEVDINRRKLDPILGTNVEAGIKSEWFNRQLYITAALFQTQQEGIAEFAGNILLPEFYAYYIGVDEEAQGFEFEFAGSVTENWRVSGGFTHLFYIEDADGNDIRTYEPRETLKLATTYNFPELNDLTLGAQLRWIGEISIDVTGELPAAGIFEQDAVTVLDLSAGVDITDSLRLNGVVRNVTDEFYRSGISYVSQGPFAAGQNFLVSLNYNF